MDSKLVYMQYSKVGLTNVLYNIRKDDLDKNLTDL